MEEEKRELSKGTKTAIVAVATVLYIVFPLDLLPDPIYLDDLIVLLASMVYFYKTHSKQLGVLFSAILKLGIIVVVIVLLIIAALIFLLISLVFYIIGVI